MAALLLIKFPWSNEEDLGASTRIDNIYEAMVAELRKKRDASAVSMANLETVQMEKEYLLNSSREIWDRVREFNNHASPEDRLLEKDFPSWDGHALSGKGKGEASKTRKTPEELSWLASRSNHRPGTNLHYSNQAVNHSNQAQYRGLTPGSNLLVVSQQGRESSGNFSPKSKPSLSGQPELDKTWPSLPSLRGGTSQVPPGGQTEHQTSGKSTGSGPGTKGNAKQSEPPGEPSETNKGAASEPETQFEPMGKRNPTWAEVTEQNLRRLDPFARFADMPLVDNVEAGEIEEILDGLISTTAPVENCSDVRESDIVDIDPRFLVSSTRYLKEASVVIYTMDLKVSFRYVETWAEQIFKQTLGVQVLSIFSLSRNCFHICLDSGLSRNHVFANAPYYMGEAMVYTLPWDLRFNPNELRARSGTIWRAPRRILETTRRAP
ncbi:hypothetical protein R1sor_010533 [Riccia sorocarpa]|uniref:Uncharacterized protein n=1 Tax=Riccia sorocarpa TaxID=122646 RepID=A0ABD3I121_9MARC